MIRVCVCMLEGEREVMSRRATGPRAAVSFRRDREEREGYIDVERAREKEKEVF